MTKATELNLQQAYQQLLRDNKGDVQGCTTAGNYLAHAYPEGLKQFSWAMTPLVLSAEQRDILSEAAATMGSIMEKVMAKYHRDRTFRALFGLPKDVEDLTLVPSGCHAAVPLSRVDVFFDTKTNDYKICGIVTGGVDGMAPSTAVNHALTRTEAYRTFTAEHASVTSYNVVHECVLTLLHTYGKWANAGEGNSHPTHPSLAVVDVPDSPRMAETRAIIENLHEQGCYARATDFSQLRIEQVGDSRQLVDNHGPVTCVWLRATIDEALAAGEGMRALAEATRRGLVCTVGGYRSWPCCTRTFFKVLRSRECENLLNRTERLFIAEHIPEVHIINPASDLSAFYDQENWVLKTADGHAPESVESGRDMSKFTWRNRLIKSIKRRDAVQAYIPQQQLDVYSSNTAGEMEERPMNIMLGLFVYESKLSGIQASCGTGYTIADWDDRLEMGCIVVED